MKCRLCKRLKALAKNNLPTPLLQWLRKVIKGIRRSTSLNFGDLRRLEPLSVQLGFDRGQPIDRYYIEKFLVNHQQDIRGRVLESGDDMYCRQFGANVSQSDIIDVFAGNPKATIIADLSIADTIDDNSFDCIILTQVLQMIYDVKAAYVHIHRILKPGGVLLMTGHGISPICCREDEDNWGEYWHFTTQSVKRLIIDTFESPTVEVCAFGNVFSTSAYLYGLASEELTNEELEYNDPRFELLVCARVVKAS